MIVSKFGGTSVADVTRILAVAGIVAQDPRQRIVVTSAVGGVTDRLHQLAESARDGRERQLAEIWQALKTQHLLIAEALGNGSDPLREFVEEQFDDLDQLVQGVLLLRELSNRTLDRILSFGEILASEFLALAIEGLGISCRAVDARGLLLTDSQFGGASVDMEISCDLSQQFYSRLKQECAVVTGFIASDAEGETTTLGRGGSDYTAALVGNFLAAEEIWIWTDVDGVLTADPRIVQEARVLPEISYNEAAEMAYFGSKVIHPSTMIPAVNKSIPVRIKNSLRPEQPGTLIHDRKGEDSAGVKTVSAISGMSLVTVEGRGMIGVPGIVQRVFAATARTEANVYVISQASSEQNITFLVSQEKGAWVVQALEQEFELELETRRVDRIRVDDSVGALAIIGEGMRGTPGISQKLFTALGSARINVLAIAQGSSERNVTVVVAQRDLKRAVGAVHTRFGLTRDTHVVLFGNGLIGRTLLKQLLQSAEKLGREHHIGLKVIGVASSRHWLFAEQGLAGDVLQQIESGVGLKQLGAIARPSDADVVKIVTESQRLDVVFVDLTAADTQQLHRAAVQHGIHVVTANKKPVAGDLGCYREIRKTALERGLGYHFETTFGAGLPVLFTLQNLLQTHDTIKKVTGCFSGTLGYLCSQLHGGVAFSKAVLDAKEMGFTEPDPRDDLSGKDVARKAIIIAREMGMDIEMGDVQLQGLVDGPLMVCSDTKDFLARLPEVDALFEQKVRDAEAQSKVLRYMAQIDSSGVKVGLRSVDRASAEGQLDGPDNILVYRTERYREFPLIIRGPGAGAEVTAAGVFGDILRIAHAV